MTSKLEEKFFQTFNIEKRDYYDCDLHGVFCAFPHHKCDKKCPYYNIYKTEYPPITDTILLNLIVVCGRYDEKYRGLYSGYAYIKDTVLIHLLNLFEALTVKPWIMPHVIIPGGASKLVRDIELVFNGYNV